MKRVIKWLCLLLIAFGFICIVGGMGAHVHAATTTSAARPYASQIKSCEVEHGAEIMTTQGAECLGEGSQAFFFSVTAIRNYTNVTVSFVDRTLGKTFHIAPGQHETFAGDRGTVDVPLH